MAKSFLTRLTDLILEDRKEYYEKVGYAFRGKHDKCFHSIYQVALYKLRKYEQILYTEWDLRGLSSIEKEYIRDNGMKNYVDIHDFSYSGKTERVYLVIRKNGAGRKSLYGFMKKQWLDLNGKHFNPFYQMKGGFNYDKLLLFTPREFGPAFSRFNYEQNGYINCPFGLGI